MTVADREDDLDFSFIGHALADNRNQESNYRSNYDTYGKSKISPDNRHQNSHGNGITIVHKVRPY